MRCLHRERAFVLTACWVFLWVGDPLAAMEDLTGFDRDVAPFLRAHCVKCHGAGRHEARLMLHKIAARVDKAATPIWEAVAEQLESEEMPPEEEPRPDRQRVRRVVEWIRAQLEEVGAEESSESIRPEYGNRVRHELLFSAAENESAPATPARIWRVRPSIYESFVEHASRQPFHRRFKRGSTFSTPWGLTGDGLRDYSALYWIGEAETELLISNAMQVASNMSRKRGTFRSESKVFRDFLRSQRDPSTDDLERVITAAYQQILERVPTADETARYGSFLRRNLEKLGRETGLQTTLAALLLQPEAVFRFELGHGERDEHGRVRLAPTELAYAIAFALTDETPDETLVRAATDGTLSTATGVRAQAFRLLAAPRADERLSRIDIARRAKRRNPPLLRFFREYFGYAKAPRVFKDLATKRKARLRGIYSPASLVSDTDLLVLHIVETDQDVLRELLTSNLSFVATGSGRWSSLESLKERAQKNGKPTPTHPFVDKRNRINEHYNLDPSEWREDMPFPPRRRASEPASSLSRVGSSRIRRTSKTTRSFEASGFGNACWAGRFSTLPSPSTPSSRTTKT